jgi:hypothetical protein
MANRLFIGFLVLLLLVLLTWSGIWFFHNFERVEQEVRTGYSAEARRNPLLAAERFLQRLGRQAESFAGRDRLKGAPSAAGLLLVKDLGPSLPLSQEQALLDWVADGNRLIASLSSAPGEDETNNHLLEVLGVRLVELALEDQAEDPLPVELIPPGEAEPIQVTFRPDRVLRFEGEDSLWRVPAGDGYHLLSLAWGSGSITLLSDTRFFANSRIEQRDHAWMLARLTENAPRIWLLYSSQMPSLLSLVWRHGQELAISGSLLLLLGSWWLAYRSGPILARSDPPRRDLLEHLGAAAEFLWQQDRGASLLERSRRQLEQRWMHSHPRLQRMDLDDRCRWLADRTGLSHRAIRQALHGEVPLHERSLIETSLTQQRLFAALEPDKRYTR